MNSNELTLSQTIWAFLVVVTLFLFVAHLDYLQTL